MRDVNQNQVNGIVGRPSTYTREIADEVLRRMCEGETMHEICSDPHIPSRGTVTGWTEDGFPDRYAQARELQGHALADMALEAARRRSDNTQADRLEFDAARWLAGKVAPRHYGDKIDHTMAAPGGGPVVFKWED